MSDETKDELTLEERQLAFDELMRRKIEKEETTEEKEQYFTKEDFDSAPPMVKVAIQTMAQSSHEAKGIMNQVDMMSGNNTGMMIRNTFEMLLQQQLFVKNLLLLIADKEGLFEENNIHVPSQSPDRRDPRFRQFSVVNPSNGLDQPEDLPSGGEGELEGDDNRGGSGGAGRD